MMCDNFLAVWMFIQFDWVKVKGIKKVDSLHRKARTRSHTNVEMCEGKNKTKKGKENGVKAREEYGISENSLRMNSIIFHWNVPEEHLNSRSESYNFQWNRTHFDFNDANSRWRQKIYRTCVRYAMCSLNYSKKYEISLIFFPQFHNGFNSVCLCSLLFALHF